MDAFKKVVWQEGMFIAPQHFQQQDRYVQNYIRQNIETLAGFAPFFGITELVLNHDLLKIGKLSIPSCSGVFPDGTQFNLKQEIVVDIPQGTIETIVYLALPISLQGNNDYSEDGQEQSRYITRSINVFDTSTSENASVEVDVAQLNIGLKFAGEDTSGFTLIPVAKILEISDSDEVMLDRAFIPACLHYGASTLLSERVKEIHALVSNRAQNLLKRIEAGQGQKSPQSMMQDFLWLQTLNTWLPWFELTISNTKYPTHELYSKLKQFEAQVMALTPAIPNECQPLKYDKLYDNFNPLFSSLRNLLTLVQQDSVIEFKWDISLFEKRRLLRTLIKDPSSVYNRRFVLSVKSDISSTELNELFPISAKLSSNNKIVELVRSSLSGISLTPLPIAPSELKPMQGVAYFEVDTKDRNWLDMLDTRDAIALHVDARIPTLEVILYALR
ncbi:putative Type VI secretion system baseplate component TssK1 [Vibrio chagasii]|nr:putative Type VI secretion system baseplate component TssK1 [Vibrio chagasii]CAH6914280.1 putative Type VI secretion system baseplate component TssK1 [Vibrio chagasii]CAH6941747.1 putative Type VI secretion system baseplate component TssK1 [Vibrio chagasii]CAH7129030.1 putative Type VI secretion system baseplate component TssK1 [Vibrio chagasii]CAH7145168.1 putative Type VI secretion system baseplate component TssK1 [Vibrio chagasii]